MIHYAKYKKACSKRLHKVLFHFYEIVGKANLIYSHIKQTSDNLGPG